MNLDELDFGPEDNGKFKHPETVGDYSYAELEAKVIAAMTPAKGAADNAACRTLPRIKKHAGLPEGFDLSVIIEGMELDKKIRRRENGICTAFFFYDQMPKRFWLIGDGTVGAEFDETFVPSPTKTLKEFTEENKQARDTAKLFNRDQRGRTYIDIDADTLEKAIAEHGTNALAAKALGIGGSTLHLKLSEQPTLRAARDRGLATYNAEHPKAASAKPEKVKSTLTSRAAARQLVISADTFKDYASRGLGVTDIARDFGISENAVYNRRGKTANKIAWHEGERIFKAAQHNAEPIEVNMNGTERLAVKSRLDNLTPDEVEKAASTCENLKDIARAVANCGQPAFSRALNRNPHLRRAYDRGRKVYRETNGPLHTPKKKDAIVKAQPKPKHPTRIGMDLEEKDLQPMIADPIPSSTPPHAGSAENQTVTLLANQKVRELSNGGKLVLGFDGSFFDLSPADRELLGKLADVMQETI